LKAMCTKITVDNERFNWLGLLNDKWNKPFPYGWNYALTLLCTMKEGIIMKYQSICFGLG
jgi:hypothetical protein